MAKAPITIVDENDNVIGSKERESITKDDIYRVTCLWITNSKGQILLAKRAMTKSHDPGKWGPAVAGTVEEGESYDEVMVREAFEELGLRDIPMQKTKKIFSVSNWKHFTQCYTTELDYSLDQFVVQEDEVDEIKWFDRDELIRLVREKSEMFIQTMPNVMLNFEVQ